MIYFPVIAFHKHNEQFIFKPQLELRTRYERRTDGDFNEAANDNKSYLYSRIRPGLTWESGKKWSGELQYQYAHQLQWSQSGNSSGENSDLFLAYATVKEGAGKFTVGRQKINFGTTRLIGSPDWGNMGRSYDAIRYQDKTIDAFGGRIGVMNNRPNFARMVGVNVKGQQNSTGIIYKHDESGTGDVDIYTLNQTYSKDFGFAKLEAEGALQGGKTNGKTQEAWAFHANLSRPIGKKAVGYIEVNSASGGSTATKNRTFDMLYPCAHGIYGAMDIQGWKNVNQIAVGYNRTLNEQFGIGFRASTNDLRDPRDAWYAASGSANKSGSTTLVDATGSSGRHLGEEFNLELTYKPKLKGSLCGGIAAFAPGTFVKTLVGSSQSQYWGYLQYSVKF